MQYLTKYFILISKKSNFELKSTIMIPVIIEVIISIVVIYFLMSTLVSFVFEAIAMFLNNKGRLLKRALTQLLGEELKNRHFTDKIYNSKHIKNIPTYLLFCELKKKAPQEIDANDFANAVLEQIKIGNEQADTNINILGQYKKELNKDKTLFINKVLLEFINEIEEEIKTSEENISDLKKKIEDWFNSYMDTVSEFYKSQSKIIMFVISIILTFSMNIDSLVLIEYFYENEEQREVMVKYANNIEPMYYSVDTNLDDTTRFNLMLERKDSLLADLNFFELPIGWRCNPDTSLKVGVIKYTISQEIKTLVNDNMEISYLKKFLGLLLTSISLTLGAPFWYDLMVKLLAFRKTFNMKKEK